MGKNIVCEEELGSVGLKPTGSCAIAPAKISSFII
jgi:hypothetical protein